MTRASGGDGANPDRADPGWPPAVIAGAYQTGVLAVRSLLRRGVQASCFDCHLDYPGFRSVYGPARACPDPDADPSAWLDFMVNLAGTTDGRAVLIPSADQFVTAIAAHAGTLAEKFIIPPAITLQGMLADKHTQYALAAEHGMPLPRTQLVGTEHDLAEFARGARFPCLLKPLHFREWQTLPPGHLLSHEKLVRAATPEALQRVWRLAADANPHLIAQEIIEGPDTHKRVYVACYSRTGERIANAMFRALRCDPPGFGPATISEPAVDPETEEVCDRFLRRIGYTGVCEIEMKWDSRDGRVKLIEANPRLTGNGDAAPYAGVDMCWLHYLDSIGQDVTPVSAAGNDFRHVVLRADLAAVVKYWRGGLLSWRDLVHSYRPPLAFYDLDRTDWRYSVQTIYRAVRSMLGALTRSFFGRRRAGRTPADALR